MTENVGWALPTALWLGRTGWWALPTLHKLPLSRVCPADGRSKWYAGRALHAVPRGRRRVGMAHRVVAGPNWMVGGAQPTGIAAVYYGAVEAVRT